MRVVAISAAGLAELPDQFAKYKMGMSDGQSQNPGIPIFDDVVPAKNPVADTAEGIRRFLKSQHEVVAEAISDDQVIFWVYPDDDTTIEVVVKNNHDVIALRWRNWEISMIDRWKKEAKRLKKALHAGGDINAIADYYTHSLNTIPVPLTEVTHTDCLNVVARKNGYKSWQDCMHKNGKE